MNDFWPKDDEETIYVDISISLSNLLEKIKEKWGNISMENILIESDYIHTKCLGYDLFDSSDWTNFLVIKRIK